MAVPRFLLVQGVSAFTSGAVTEFSTNGATGAALNAIIANMNFSSNIGPTGPRSNNTWSATYPVTQGNNSYEFIWGLQLVSVADNSISNCKVWAVPFTNPAGCTFYIGTDKVSGFSAPSASVSTKAASTFTVVNGSSASAYINPGVPSNITNALSDPIWCQVRTTGAAVGGNQTGMPVIGISLDFS